MPYPHLAEVFSIAPSAMVITLGARCRTGGHGIRIATIIIGALMAVNGILGLLTGQGALGLVAAAVRVVSAVGAE
ncbi:hypothetical protein [Streptomyces violascens]|uniref:hypothetical protein n=1 Tax=Streptomyces violascens TaxID=67381 RepID=UPI00369B6AB0